MARRSVVAPPATTASASSATDHGRGAPAASGGQAAAPAPAALIASHGAPVAQPERRRRGVARLVVGDQARSPVSATASAMAPRDVTAAS